MMANRPLFSTVLSAILVLGATGAALGDSQVTVLPRKLLQRIDGFGASDAWYAPEIHSFAPAQQAEILDDLFSTATGAGLSLLRHRVPYEIEPSPGVFDWTQDGDSVWLSQQAVARGVSQIWSTVWSPPAWMKSNNNVNNGGEVSPAHYQDFATYLSSYIEHYAKSFGVKISAISFANEPDITATYESSNWTSQQFHDFIANDLMPNFLGAKQKAQIILPELSYWSDGDAAATLADPITANFVGIIASHDYAGTLAPFTDAQSAQKAVWETEVSNLGGDDPSITDGIAWATRIHDTLVVAQANAWHYWWLYSDISDTTGQSLIQGSPTTNTFTTKKRLWTIGNFSRFVRPGAHMVAVSSNNPEPGVYVTAFMGVGGDMSVVAINSNSASTNLVVNTGQPHVNLTCEYRTSATENLSFVGVIPTVVGRLSAALASQSVTTFHLAPIFRLMP